MAFSKTGGLVVVDVTLWWQWRCRENYRKNTEICRRSTPASGFLRRW